MRAARARAALFVGAATWSWSATRRNADSVPRLDAAPCVARSCGAGGTPDVTFMTEITMRRSSVFAATTLLVAIPVLAALPDGTKAPPINTKATLAGKEFNFSLADALKKGPV